MLLANPVLEDYILLKVIYLSFSMIFIEVHGLEMVMIISSAMGWARGLKINT
jgi:hypothetical protein